MIIIITTEKCPHCIFFMQNIYPKIKHLEKIVILQMHDLPLVLGAERILQIKHAKLNLPMILVEQNGELIHLKNPSVEDILNMENINK